MTVNRRSFFSFLAGAPLAVAAGKVFAGQSFASVRALSAGEVKALGTIIEPQPLFNVVRQTEDRQDVEINMKVVEGVRMEVDMIRDRYTVIVECNHGDERVYDGDDANHASSIKSFWQDVAAFPKMGVRTCFGDVYPAIFTDYAMIPSPSAAGQHS